MSAPISNARITKSGSRGEDGDYGSGQWHAVRTDHIHQGLDLKAEAGEIIRSPIDGVVTRDGAAYRKGDPEHHYRLIEIRGDGKWEGYSIKLLYVLGFLSGRVEEGQPVGVAQDLRPRYPANARHKQPITNHIHMEVRKDGRVIDPRSIYAACF
jgi:hypothetical protein